MVLLSSNTGKARRSGSFVQFTSALQRGVPTITNRNAHSLDAQLAAMFVIAEGWGVPHGSDHLTLDHCAAQRMAMVAACTTSRTPELV